MAIDPKLVSIKTAGELPVSDPSDNANFLFYEGETLQTSPMSNIYDKVSSGLLPATTATVPEATGFHRYLVHTAGTYTNFSGIVVTAADLDIVNGVANNRVILEVNEGEAIKRVERVKGDKGDEVKIKTINLFNKETFLDGWGINGAGEVISINPQNGITDFIPVEGGENYGWAVMYNGTNSKSIFPRNNIDGLYFVEYDENKTFIQYTDVLSHSNITTTANTRFVLINSNSTDGFKHFIERFVFAKTEDFPFGYVDYNSVYVPKFQGDLQFYTKSEPTAFNSDIAATFSGEMLTIPSGNLSLYAKKVYEFLFRMEYGGNARIAMRISGNIRPILPSLLTGTDLINTNNAFQPSISLFESQYADEFYLIAEGNFNARDILAFAKNGIKDVVLENPITAKVEFFFLYLDENGKPRNAGSVSQSDLDNIEATIPPIVDERISEKLPEAINQQVGSDLNAYFAEHIDDYTFLQPNYIQANASFDLASLTSSMNGKFISIIEDVDLGGATIDFVSQGVKNLKLVFNGGRILNGKIRSNYTRCIFNSNEAFVNVEILNQFQNPFALPEWFGAKIDGIDGGIGDFTKDDSFAINQALKFSSKVLLTGNRTSIVKKPLILRTGNTIEADPNFVVKLGAASNCTLLKNEHIDLPITAAGVVTYPGGFVRNSNITVKGGIWDGNGLKQNRGYSDRPDVVGTPKFIDGDGTDYVGFLMKFADIDGFIMQDVTLKDARTYMLAAGGLNHYRFKNILMQRSFKMENADGIHLHGHNFDGDFDGITGTAGDDLIAVTTTEASGISVRVGDVKKLRIRNVYNYGFEPGSTLDTPKLSTNGTNPETIVYRPIRLTYTDNVIDDVVIENVIGYRPQFISMIVMSYLPLAGALNIGKIGSVTIKGLIAHDTGLCLDIGGNTKIDYINLTDTVLGFEQSLERVAIIKPLENWSGVFGDYALSKVGTIVVDNMHVTHGNSVHNAADGLFYTFGRIDNLIIDKLIIEDKTSAVQSFESLISGNIGYVSVTNSKIAVQKIFSTEGNSNTNTVFRESNNEWGKYENGVYSSSTVAGIIPKRMITENIVLSSNPTMPKMGDKILKSDGVYLFTTAWNKL